MIYLTFHFRLETGTAIIYRALSHYVWGYECLLLKIIYIILLLRYAHRFTHAIPLDNQKRMSSYWPQRLQRKYSWLNEKDKWFICIKWITF